jgi:hypothetical protein
MKRPVAFSLIAAIIAVAAASPILAGGGFGHGGHMMKRSDLNRDGMTTPVEADAMGAVMFLQLDADGDGVITEAEMLEAAQARIARMIAIKFARLDQNGDGQVERAEFDDHGAARFTRLDTDGDGMISGEEIHARPHGQRRGWHDDELPNN